MFFHRHPDRFDHSGRRAARSEERHRDGGHGGRHHGFGRGRERDPARVFDHGDVRLVILALLEEAPRHGYDIIKELEERVGGGYSPSPGVIYPTLTMLEELGHAAVSEAHGGRRLYTLTEAGSANLAANRATVDAILGRLAENTSRRGPPAPVLRALENLQTAIRLRLRGSDVTPEQIRALAAAIDAAAQAVEQV